MVGYTPLDYETTIINFAKEHNIPLVTGTKFSEILKECRKLEGVLHSIEELKEICKNNLQKIKDKWGYKGLRIWFYSINQNQLYKSYAGTDRLEDKYHKLIKDIRKYHSVLIKEEFDIELDVYEYWKYLEDVYDEIYGILKPSSRLYALMKTINITYYNEDVVNTLKNYLRNELRFCGDNYYIQKDLSDKDTLDMLWEHIGEMMFDDDCYLNENIFYNCDGYGNIYCDVDDFRDVPNEFIVRD